MISIDINEIEILGDNGRYNLVRTRYISHAERVDFDSSCPNRPRSFHLVELGKNDGSPSASDLVLGTHPQPL